MNKSWKSSEVESNIYFDIDSKLLASLQDPDARKTGLRDGFIEGVAREVEHGQGFAVIRNFDISGSTEEVQSRYLALMRNFGSICNQNNFGHQISDVRDEQVSVANVKEGLMGNKTAGQTKNRPYLTNAHLEFHTDLADMATLLCLNQSDHGGENRVTSSIRVLEVLKAERPDLLAALQQPLYLMHQTPSKPDGNNHLIMHQPFTSEQGFFSSFLLGSYILATYHGIGMPLPDLVAEAIDAVQVIASREENTVAFKMRPGDIMLMNNHVTYHSRNAFEDDSKAEPRHLMRTWISTYDNRPLAASMAGLYGEDRLAAGSIRGGFEKVDELAMGLA